MILTDSRSMIRVLGTPSSDIPKTFFSVKRSNKDRRLRKNSEIIDAKRLSLHQANELASSCLPTDKNIFAKNVNINFASTYIFPSGVPFHSFFYEKIYSALSKESIIFVDNEYLLTLNSNLDNRIDSHLRTETLSKLWSLHTAYYSLSSVVFCKAVKPKYAMCVAVACYYITSKFNRSEDCVNPTFENLINLSRCGGTTVDLARMMEIILAKIGSSTVTAIGANSSTAINFFILFFNLGIFANKIVHDSGHTNFTQDGNFLKPIPVNICRQVEFALTSTEASCFRPTCLALALLNDYCLHLNNNLAGDWKPSEDFCWFSSTDLFNLATFCNIPWTDVDKCLCFIKKESNICSEPYTVGNDCSSRLLGSSPPLVWTLSRRTQRSISSYGPPALSTVLESNEEAVGVDGFVEDLINLDLNS